MKPSPAARFGPMDQLKIRGTGQGAAKVGGSSAASVPREQQVIVNLKRQVEDLEAQGGEVSFVGKPLRQAFPQAVFDEIRSGLATKPVPVDRSRL